MLFYTCIYKQNKRVKSRRKQLKEFILLSSRIETFKLLITHSKRRFERINQTSSFIRFSQRQWFHCYYLVQVAVKNIGFVKFQIFLTVFKTNAIISFLNGNVFHNTSFYINKFNFIRVLN